MTEPTIIDVKMHGLDAITGSFLVTGERTALVETGPKTGVDHVFAGLDAAGIDSLDYIVVTHIHLDHAGAAGTLAAKFPSATVFVHEVGAPHLADPSKLWSSASRIYGDDMERLWGGIDPIPAERIQVIEDGGKIDLGGRSLQAIETPGHAYHHHAFLDDATGIVFTGDALGVRLPDTGVVRPATPPPEFHLEKAIGSVRRIQEVRPTALWLTHFGSHEKGVNAGSVDDTCHASIESLQQWAEWITEAREGAGDIDEVSAVVRDHARHEYEADLAEDQIERMENTTSYRMNTWGYMRYLDKLGS